jgi:sugar lactone lactonase YvrE
VLVPGRAGRAAIGLKVRGDRIIVAGGPTGKAFVYDARDGSDVGEFVLTEETTFVNDVALARGAAYFTDSINPQLYVLQGGEVSTLPLTGDLQYDDDPGTFELNGIAPAGRRLIAVQSRTGKLFEIDPRTGDTREIDLGGESLPNGDGLLRQGKRLYVVQNRLNQVAVVDLRRGEIVRRITDDDFRVPTTVARKGRYLWLPNARFGTPPGPDVEYEVVRVSR